MRAVTKCFKVHDATAEHAFSWLRAPLANQRLLWSRLARHTRSRQELNLAEKSEVAQSARGKAPMVPIPCSPRARHNRVLDKHGRFKDFTKTSRAPFT